MIRPYNIQLDWTYHPAWLIGCVLIGLLAALFLYYKDKNMSDWKSWQKITMAVLRFLTVSTLLALLLHPVIKLFKSRTESKQVLWLQDDSRSISSIIDSLELNVFENNRDAFLQNLSKKANTKLSYFSGEVSNNSKRYKGELSNISSSLNYAWESFSDDKLSAIIIATDGIYNEGQNPIYLDGNLSIPVHVVMMGDTTAGKDIDIRRIFSNKIAYKGDDFEVEADFGISSFKGKKSNVVLYEFSSGKAKRIQSIPLEVNSNDFFKTIKFRIQAKNAGNTKYRIGIATDEEESNKNNNYRDFYVEIIDSRQKVLILANSPHPDIAAVKALLTSLENYEVDIKYAYNYDNYQTSKYDLVVLHNLPSVKHPVKNVRTTLVKQRIPLLYFVGTQTDKRTLSEEDNMLSLNVSGNQYTEATPAFNASFNLFKTDDDIKTLLKRVPPLKVPFGKINANPAFEVLAAQKIKGIDTKYPLIVCGEMNGHKKGAFLGTGFWRWKLFDFAQTNSFDRIQNLSSQLFQYLTVKGDKRRFRTYVDKSIYTENTAVQIDAEYYNASYEILNTPDVDIELTNGNGDKSNFAFSRKAGAYSIDLGKLPEGSYSFAARVSDQGEQFKSTGKFSVRAIKLETSRLRADFDLLNSLATKYKGQTYSMNQIDKLEADILNSDSLKPLYISDQSRESVINLKWLFAALLAMLGLEWFMRRYLGSY